MFKVSGEKYISGIKLKDLQCWKYITQKEKFQAEIQNSFNQFKAYLALFSVAKSVCMNICKAELEFGYT